MTMSAAAILLLSAAQATAPAAPPAQTAPAAPAAQGSAAPAGPAVQPPPEFIQAAEAFGQCVGTGASGLAATVTPEAGAKQVLTGCATQKTAMETRFEAWVTSPGFPEAGRAEARKQFASQMGGVEAQIADGIRKARAGAAAPAPSATGTPAPAPAPTPAPSPTAAPRQ